MKTLPSIEQDFPEEQWKELTTQEQERLTKDLCLKCGNEIRGQPFYGSLCTECNEAYLKIADQDRGESDDATHFLTFIRNRKEKVQFT